MTIDPDLDIEYQVREFLLADVDVASVVAARIFPAPAPQNVPGPFVTFQRTTTDRVYSNDGYAGLAGALLQIDCWSDAPEYAGSYVEAKRVAQAVRHALNGYRGMMGPLRVQETTIETEHDLFEAQDHTRRVSIDFRLWFEEEPSVMPTKFTAITANGSLQVFTGPGTLLGIDVGTAGGAGATLTLYDGVGAVNQLFAIDMSSSRLHETFELPLGNGLYYVAAGAGPAGKVIIWYRVG